jgi:hypothetical protein
LEDQASLFGSHYADYLSEQQEWARFFHEFRAQALHREDLVERWQQIHRPFVDAVSGVLSERAQRLGIQLPLAPDRLALAMVSLTNGIVMETLLDPGPVDDDLLSDALALLVGG